MPSIVLISVASTIIVQKQSPIISVNTYFPKMKIASRLCNYGLLFLQYCRVAVLIDSDGPVMSTPIHSCVLGLHD